MEEAGCVKTGAGTLALAAEMLLSHLLLGVRKCTASDIGPMPLELRAWILK